MTGSGVIGSFGIFRITNGGSGVTCLSDSCLNLFIKLANFRSWKEF